MKLTTCWTSVKQQMWVFFTFERWSNHQGLTIFLFGVGRFLVWTEIYLSIYNDAIFYGINQLYIIRKRGDFEAVEFINFWPDRRQFVFFKNTPTLQKGMVGALMSYFTKTNHLSIYSWEWSKFSHKYTLYMNLAASWTSLF